MSDIDSMVKFVSSLGVAGVLIVLVYGLLKGWFVTGREHAQLTAAFQKLQADVNDLRARDDRQQKEINDLRDQLTSEQALKVEALIKVAELKNRVAELERTTVKV